MLISDLSIPAGSGRERVRACLLSLHKKGYMYAAVDTRIPAGGQPAYDFTDYYELTRDFNRPAVAVANNPCCTTPTHELTILKRVTFDFGAANLSGKAEQHIRACIRDPMTSKYDLVACRVHSEAQYRMAIELPIDILVISASAQIKYTRALLNAAYSKGIMLELQYCGGSEILYIASRFARFGRKKGVIVSSGASLESEIFDSSQYRRYCLEMLGIKTIRLSQAVEELFLQAAGRRLRST